jgi:membrane associated rhomboid family serine protease
MYTVVGPVVYMAVRQRTSSWLLIYFVALVTAELSSVAYRQWMRDDAYSVGASGAISGMIAAVRVY